MMGNGLGKCRSSIFGVLIFISKDIPELCMLADVLVVLFLAFNTFYIFKMATYLFCITKLINVLFQIIQKNKTHKNQNTAIHSYTPSSFSVHPCLQI